MDESVLKYTIEEQGPTQQSVTGEVAWKEVKSRLDETFRELSRQVNLKGFRRGKVPRGLLDKMFGKKVREEISRQISQEAVAQAYTEKKLRVVTGPDEWEITTEDIVNEEPLKFKVLVEVLPKVEVKDYEGIEVHKGEVDITEAEIDEYLQRQREMYTQYEPVEDRTEVHPGDVVVADIMGRAGDEPIDYQSATIKIPEPDNDQPVQEPVPGLARALLGRDTAAGELDVELDLPAAEGEPPKKARLLVTIERLSRAVVPELDDDFAKETGMADDMAGLRDAVRARLAEIRENRFREEMEGELLEELRRRNPVEISDKAIRQEAMRLKGAFSSMLGMDFDSISAQDESLGKLVNDKAREQVQSSLILEAIAEKEGLEVTEDDIDAYLNKEAEKQQSSAARLKAQLEGAGRMDEVRSRLLRDKTIDLLMSKAHVKPKEEQAEGDAAKAESEPAEADEAPKKKTRAKKSAKKAEAEDAAEADEAPKKKTRTKKTTKKAKAEGAETEADEAPKKKTRAKKSAKKAEAEDAAEADEAPKKRTRAKKATKKAKAEGAETEADEAPKKKTRAKKTAKKAEAEEEQQ